MKVAIVDDELHIRHEFRRNLERYASENGVSFQIVEFADGDAIAADYSAVFDIILMDIEMPFVNGMTAAEEIRAVDEDVTIIFLTNAPQYAIKGYKVGALDYILKPVSYYAFSETIRRAIAKRQALSLREDFLTVHVKGGVRRIKIGSILYTEVIDHDLYFHTLDSVIQTRGTIREVESDLASYHFFKCNKGCLINLAYVEGYHGNVVKVRSEELQISRTRKKPLLEALNAYFDGTK